MKGMNHATRIARLEHEARRLLRRIRYAQSLYVSEYLQSAWTHVQASIWDLRIAQVGAEIRRDPPPEAS